jgi:hypothetical protein
MNIDFNTIISLLTSPEVQDNLFPVKIAFFIVSGLLLAFIIFTVLNTHYFQWLFFQDAAEFLTRRPFGAKRMARNWKKIIRRLESGSESEYKLAIIEADQMLSSALKRMGYEGPTLEERLDKLTSATLPNIEDLYNAHKLRDSIVHDPDYVLTLEEAKKTLEAFEKSFIDLQLLS